MRIKTEWKFDSKQCNHEEGDAIITKTYCDQCGEEFGGDMNPWTTFFVGMGLGIASLLLGYLIFR